MNQPAPDYQLLDLAPGETNIIDAIAARAAKLATEHGIHYSKLSAVLDLTIFQRRGRHLDLAKLQAAAPADFLHDVFGIRRYLNRETGELGGCFLPRCWRSESYNVTRTALDAWSIAGTPCAPMSAAVAECERQDEARGYVWDMGDRGNCEDGIEALRVGESMEVTPPGPDE